MARVEPLKRGLPEPRTYQNEDFYGKLQPLVAALQEEAPEAKYDAKTVALTLVQLLHFQEAALGKDAMPPRPCPKLPIKLITDPAVGGALHAVLLKLADIRRSRGLKAIEWSNPGKRKECLEVLVMLRRELERRQLLKVPLVHVSPSLGPDTLRLREYVRRLQGHLAERPDEAGVTHVVYPFGPGGDPDDGQEYQTVIAVKGKEARVHYWYMPDSYDEWVPLARLDSKEVVPELVPPGGRWKVTPRWIIDSEKFNEWMNPQDYVTREFEVQLEAERKGGAKTGGKRGAAGALGAAAKKAKTDASRPEVSAEPVAVLAPHAVLRRLLHPAKGFSDPRGSSAANLSQGQVDTHMAAYLPAIPHALQLHPEQQQPPLPQEQQEQQQAAATAAEPAAAEPAAAADAGGQGGIAAAAAATAAAAAPPRPPAPPASAGWFRYGAIHMHERAQVPEFFNGSNPSKTAKEYRAYRDAMLGLAAERRWAHLPFSDVLDALDGEANALRRIYDFLVGEGLLNYQPPAGAAGLARRAPLRVPLGPAASRAAMPPGTAALFDMQHPTLVEASAAAAAGGPYGAGGPPPAAALRGDMRGAAPGSLLTPAWGRPLSDGGRSRRLGGPVYCSALPWVECSGLRYVCPRLPDVVLCPQAYAEGRLPPGTCGRDFVRLAGCGPAPASSDGWRPEETLLLLEGLELHKEDWAAVAAHVGSRSQAACLAHFVRLPIEDGFVEGLAGGGGGGGGGAALPALPFMDEANPLMATVCCLALLLGPRVAAAAAQRALAVLAEGDEGSAADLDVAGRLAAGPPAGGTTEPDGCEQQQQQQQQAGELAGRPPPDPSGPVSKKSLVAAAVAAGLAAAATRARAMAEAEGREITRLMVSLVNSGLLRLDAKEKALAELDNLLERECAASEANVKALSGELGGLREQRKKAEATRAAQRQAAAAKNKPTQQQQQAEQQQAAVAGAGAVQHKQQQQQAAGPPSPDDEADDDDADMP